MTTPELSLYRAALALFALAGSTQAAAQDAAALDTPDASTFTLAASQIDADADTRTIVAASVAATEGATTSAERAQTRPGPQAQGTRAPAGSRFPAPKIVFDDTWATIGIGAGLVPSYGGSDDYIFFPLPLVAGRVGGIGISPNGPGFALDLASPAPAFGAQKTRFFGGPAFRVRNDRAQQIQDDVVELAEDLDWAVEVGAQAGVSFPGVFNPLDTVTLTTQVRWDIAGAHDGMLIEPSVGYTRPFGPGVRFQTNLGLQFADDSFADYYYTVTPAQSAATGLPLFTADGGLNNISSTTTLAFDLDGNGLNGGLSVFTVLGYTRFVGDAADTPFTSIRGDADNFIVGAGIAYTF
ncbi:MAG: MipA/OmpV family protein [Pseudomonadota bacterium]